MNNLLEYWSIGVLERCKKPKPQFQSEQVFISTPSLHHSNTPVLQNSVLSLLAKPFDFELLSSKSVL